jgi:hypothetical protein
MHGAFKRLAGWLAMAALAAIVSACGGGGGGDPAPQQSAPVADARNGDYTVYAADAQQYTLSLDFDAATYRMAGNGLDQQGALRKDALGFYYFEPASPADAAVNTARFSHVDGTVVGGFHFADGTLPMIASRSFLTSADEAAGTYDFVTRTVDTAAPAAAFSFQGEFTADSHLQICNLEFVSISLCPAASVTTGTVTVAGDLFTSTTPTGAFTFRVAKVGDDRVFLRGSASTATARRFWVGTPVATGFAAGTFDGTDTQGNAVTTAFGAGGSTYVAVTTTPANVVSNRIGTGTLLGDAGADSLLAVGTTTSGGLFALRTTNLAIVAGANGNSALPGYFEIGKRQ